MVLRIDTSRARHALRLRRAPTTRSRRARGEDAQARRRDRRGGVLPHAGSARDGRRSGPLRPLRGRLLGSQRGCVCGAPAEGMAYVVPTADSAQAGHGPLHPRRRGVDWSVHLGDPRGCRNQRPARVVGVPALGGRWRSPPRDGVPRGIPKPRTPRRDRVAADGPAECG